MANEIATGARIFISEPIFKGGTALTVKGGKIHTFIDPVDRVASAKNVENLGRKKLEGSAMTHNVMTCRLFASFFF